MSAVYAFDANVFIELQRRQPMDIYRSVWRKVGELMEKGTIISSQEVYEEILKGDDELKSWIKSRENYFLESSVEIQKTVRDILKDFRGLVEGGKRVNGADPFIIALAKINHAIVVTEEIPTRDLNSPHIPDVCEQLGINFTNFVGFSRDMQLSF